MKLPRLALTTALPIDGHMVTDAELDALWLGTPEGGDLRPDAEKWMDGRVRALRACVLPKSRAARREP